MKVRKEYGGITTVDDIKHHKLSRLKKMAPLELKRYKEKKGSL